MALRSEDPKDKRSAYAERQKVLHRKDRRKGKKKGNHGGLVETHARNYEYFERASGTAAHEGPFVSPRRRAFCGSGKDGDNSIKKESAESCRWEERRGKTALYDSSRAAPLERVEPGKAEGLQSSEAAYPAFERRDCLNGYSGSDELERADLELALALSLSMMHMDYPCFADAKSEADSEWVDLCEDCDVEDMEKDTKEGTIGIRGTGTSGVDMERPTYAQMAKIEVT
ncbi:hypothetical protein DFH11DRAFT_1549516 [Phellopilus nigrolimitatus]|nr:hypothetical protein DFH11DRAFT_1549516 [Phellopilus nigrolimitatus]